MVRTRLGVQAGTGGVPTSALPAADSAGLPGRPFYPGGCIRPGLLGQHLPGLPSYSAGPSGADSATTPGCTVSPHREAIPASPPG